MKQKLRTKLTLSFALVVLLTIALISLLSNHLVSQQFEDYMLRQQEQKVNGLATILSHQYDSVLENWNADSVYTIGMYALNEGYIIKVYDSKNRIIWDAQAHDMSFCAEMMEDIANRMQQYNPQVNGEFTSTILHLIHEDEIIGYVNILYYGPFFLSENDFSFLNALNNALIGTGIFSLIASVTIGIFIAKRLSIPLHKTVEATKNIADGNYKILIHEKTKIEEIELLITSVNQLATSLERQQILRKQLTYDVSHELRTPITIVQTHLEAMIEGLWEPSQERLQDCHDEITRIGKLVSDLENLAKTDHENLKLNKSEINLMEMTRSIVKGFEVELANKDLNVTLEGRCSSIQADKDKINQVVLNLMTNAIKYSKTGGNINIIFEENDEIVSFRIQDDGIGIPEDELPYIFERFYRADKSRNRMTGGSGLGLAIVKSIVEAHGGKVMVESKLNKGSMFEVILPK
ncbi:MAG TPA: two-component sensor histidine kinase [Clostridiales bacterium]|jgi:signal transduction histidine kinase|nr:two-component sensor histidine kinase [Clostridiales bacterium]